MFPSRVHHEKASQQDGLLRKAIGQSCSPFFNGYALTTSTSSYPNFQCWREGETFIEKRKLLKLKSGSAYLPKENKSKPQGEDAHFISKNGCTIGIADGVGGWSKQGIDSGEYSRGLMKNARKAVKRYENQVGYVLDLESVLTEAYWKTTAQGSSTACIITLTDQHCLTTVNIGDSGFIVIRDGVTVYRSPKQRRGFNCPYQLGYHKTCGRPCSTQKLMIELKDGDVIVVETNGLFDNMFDSEIEKTVKRGKESGKEGSRELAECIAELALYNSFETYARTPFQIESEKFGKNHRGGKVDDIIVVVSCVVGMI